MLNSGTSSCSISVGKCISIRFLWVTTLFGLTNFPGVTILETSLIDTEGTGIENTCVKGFCNGGACIKTSCSKVTCIERPDVEDTCSLSAYIGNTSAKKACTRSVCIGDACVDGASAVECSEMHLQFLQISEVKLFGIGLKTGIGAN